MAKFTHTKNISEPFGMYRAESLKAAVYELFFMPSYFPELETPRACVLLGGRGTGKTTVLKCLSYEGKDQLERRKTDPEKPEHWAYYGFYHKINTNRVAAFEGPELTKRQWSKVFGHYINVVFCNEVIKFAEWYKEKHNTAATLQPNVCEEVSASLFAGAARTQSELALEVRSSLRKFERLLNNLSKDDLPEMSVQGQPIDDLCEALLQLPQFKDKSFFFIIDEFENLLDYQQIILNTLIKHCGEFYTFKVGIKELGWRQRATQNTNEQLVSPADYERIDIGQRLDDRTFKEFAENVCLIRAKQEATLGPLQTLDELLPSMDVNQESDRLGVGEKAKIIREDWARQGIARKKTDKLSDLEVYFTDFWVENKRMSPGEVLDERHGDPKKWKDRFENYRFSMLFTIKNKKSSISKYYCGWLTYVLLANGNIRYLLELVGRSIQLNKKNKSAPFPISPEIQTQAAHYVARKNFLELEGLSIHGAQLTKLLLGLGSVFESLASSPKGHAPEYTQFHFADNEVLSDKVRELLEAAVMHLALVRTDSSKRMSLETRSSDYAIHPIFAPFFRYSYRRKRKITLKGEHIDGLISDPKKFIKIVTSRHISELSEGQLQQMPLFREFNNNGR